MSTIEKVKTYDHNTDKYAPPTLHFPGVNVHPVERVVSGLLGGSLVAYGAKRFDLLGGGLALLGGALLYRCVVGNDPLYGALNVNTANHRVTGTVEPLPDRNGFKVHYSLTVNRPASELYAYWRDETNAPNFTPFVQQVVKTGERTSHWVAKAASKTVDTWNSELLQDKTDSVIAWHVHGKSLTGNAGKVTFAPATEGRGTVVTLEADYYGPNRPLLSRLGAISTKAAEYQVQETVRRFKSLMETGEISSIEGQSRGNQ